MTVSTLLTEALKARVRRPSLYPKLTTAKDLIASGIFKNGMRMGWVIIVLVEVGGG